MEKALRNNISKIYLMVFFQSAMVVTAIFVPLMQQHGLTMAQVLQTQALFALAVALLEVPSGYLADLWGRKNTILCGEALCLISFLWLIQADGFGDFIIYELLMGIGVSLCSGADLALLYDSQSALQRLKSGHGQQGSQHISRLVSVEGIAGGIAALVTSVLCLWSMDWVLYVQALTSAIAVLFALTLVEAPREISVGGHRDNAQRIKQAILQNPTVQWTALAIITFTLMALYAFWLYQKYWESLDIPLHWFGYIWGTHCLVRGLTARLAPALERQLGLRNLFVVMAALPIIGLVGMGMINTRWGLLFGLLIPFAYGLSTVVFYDALNQRVAAEFRATANSLVSLGVRSIFIVTGPVLGYLVDSQGVSYAILTLAVVFLPLLALVLITLASRIRVADLAAASGDETEPATVLVSN